jgi:hypothetical protein
MATRSNLPAATTLHSMTFQPHLHTAMIPFFFPRRPPTNLSHGRRIRGCPGKGCRTPSRCPRPGCSLAMVHSRLVIRSQRLRHTQACPRAGASFAVGEAGASCLSRRMAVSTRVRPSPACRQRLSTRSLTCRPRPSKRLCSLPQLQSLPPSPPCSPPHPLNPRRSLSLPSPANSPAPQPRRREKRGLALQACPLQRLLRSPL